MEWLDRHLRVDAIDTHIDPGYPVARAIITHGHADHARAGHGQVLATAETIEIMKLRYGADCAGHFQALAYGEPLTIDGFTVTLFPAGHILGSAQVAIDHGGRRVVITGDYKTEPDRTAPAFELVPCDVFVTEATFGLPVFRHGPASDEIAKLLASVAANPGRCHVVGTYALGKAQRVLSLLRAAGYDKPVFIHGALDKLCGYYQDKGIALGPLTPVAGRDRAELRDSIVLAPPGALKDQWSRRLPDPVIAYASGWMSIRQRAKQSRVELPLVLSDHADWGELTATIPATGAEEIWITHGREDALQHWCESQGLFAKPLSLHGREEEAGE